ncbi:MAG TPA: response regulator [Opitutaceae bacterium]|nr:response regulator [Opitutaceae bacterium]
MARPLFMVDDEEIDRLLFQRLLAQTGVDYPCRQFSSGEQLIDALITVLRGATPPIACFVDVRMSGMTGFDVLRWIRCQRALDDIAVVMLSSSEEPHDLSDALYFGAQCYVAKFPAAPQLREILDEADAVASAARDRPFKINCNLLLPSSQAAGVRS